MKHLKPAEVIDAAEGTSSADAREHLLGCVQCRDEVSRAAAMLREVRSDEAPEPSPLFWEHFSTHVREKIDTEAVAVVERGHGRWIWIPAGGLVAMLAIAAGLSLRAPGESGMTPTRPAAPAVVTTAETGSPEDAGDANWAIVAESADGFTWEEGATGEFAVRPGAAERAVMQLSDDQREELARLLREEIGTL